MRTREPGGGNSVSFIGVDEVECARADQAANGEGRRNLEEAARSVMHGNTRGSCALAKGRALRCEKFGFMAAGAQPIKKKKSLVLSTAPGGFQIDKQGPHVRSPLALSLAVTSFPSFVYLSRTERAAICAIRAPR